MLYYYGVLFALVALFAWGFGDFFIQRATRAVGIWKSLFFIGFLGFLVLLPFVKDELLNLTYQNFLTLLFVGAIVMFGALFDFEALRQGKIAVIDPIIGLELPMTVALSLFVAREVLSPLQLFLIGIVFLGIVLAITKSGHSLKFHKRTLEKGVFLALFAAVGMALTNFLVGFASQKISPLMTIWFTHSVIAVICLTYIIVKGEIKTLVPEFFRHKTTIIFQSVFDNAAWFSFAMATTYIPIAIATTISESYIALAVLLGIFVNKERLKNHQIVGIILATFGVVAISYFS